MHIDIESTAEIAKAFTQKLEKKSDDTQAVMGHLKFANCFVSREAVDEFMGQLIGWSQSCLFDEFGVPTVRAEIALPFFEAELTGVIAGVKPGDKINISRATIAGVKLALTKLGACLSGEIAWEIAGDESAELVPLQGNECRVHFVLQEPKQLDLVQQARDDENRLHKMARDIHASSETATAT